MREAETKTHGIEETDQEEKGGKKHLHLNVVKWTFMDKHKLKKIRYSLIRVEEEDAG